jgi:hypothetical protein
LPWAPEKVIGMTTAAESWLISLGASLGIVTLLGLALLAPSRARRVRRVVVHCPENGLPVVVQDLSGMGGLITRVVTCRAFANARPITCGLPCLAGRVHARAAEHSPAKLLDA